MQPNPVALLTGWHAIRSGNHSVPIGQTGGWGLVAWEKTLGDLLTAHGYVCAAYGKWHVGEDSGRWPTDKDFTEWYGPPRTYDEALWPTDPWYDPARDPISRMLETGRVTATSPSANNSPSRYGAIATPNTSAAPTLSSETQPPTGRRSFCTSITRCCICLSLPVVNSRARQNKVTGLAADVDIPDDRVIDSVDQLDWLTGATPASNRDGYLYWMGPEIYGVRWRNFKLVLVEQRYMSDAAARLPVPRLINLTTDPHERERIGLPHLHTWVGYHCNAMLTAFQDSINREPLIPMGAPLGHLPKHAV